jgi:hypothetical protein
MACLRRQLLKIKELNTPISLTERMHVIHVAQYQRGCCDKRLATETSEKIGVHEAPMNVSHAGLDEPTKLELLRTLGNFHRADFARPVVKVLEKVTMDVPEMVKVKVAWRNAFGGTLRHNHTLGRLQSIGIF